LPRYFSISWKIWKRRALSSLFMGPKAAPIKRSLPVKRRKKRERKKSGYSGETCYPFWLKVYHFLGKCQNDQEHSLLTLHIFPQKRYDTPISMNKEGGIEMANRRISMRKIKRAASFA